MKMLCFVYVYFRHRQTRGQNSDSYIEVHMIFTEIYMITLHNMFPKPLSREEETEYLSRMAAGDMEAREVLIERNLRLVAHVVKKYVASGTEGEDLISIGTIGLIKAIATFDNGKGIHLGTYAVRCIENEILMYLRSTKKHSQDVSMNEPVGIDGEGNEISLADLLSQDDGEMLDAIDSRDEQTRVREIIRTVLTRRERRIIELRFGLLTGEEMTQKQVGQMLGLSRSYISRLEHSAIEKIKKHMG